jgi:hypothetical protein
MQPSNESEVGQLIQLKASQESSILFRNNSGAFKDATGRPVRFGLGNVSKKFNAHMKSSDYIGITRVVITPEMVGKTVGVFTAVEVKEPNWTWSGTERELAQEKYIKVIQSHGSIGFFAKSVDDYINGIEDYIFRASAK